MYPTKCSSALFRRQEPQKPPAHSYRPNPPPVHGRYNLKDITTALATLRASNPKVYPVGKTAEVVRGLYDTCNALQFYWPHDKWNATMAESIAKELHYMLQQNGKDRRLQALDTRHNRAYITEYGIIYYEAIVDGQFQIDYIDNAHGRIINLMLNYQWVKSSGFYDSEMKKANHYKAVYDFVSEVSGDDSDVRAVRALLDYADKKTASSLDHLNRVLSEATNCDALRVYVEQLK